MKMIFIILKKNGKNNFEKNKKIILKKIKNNFEKNKKIIFKKNKKIIFEK